MYSNRVGFSQRSLAPALASHSTGQLLHEVSSDPPRQNFRKARFVHKILTIGVLIGMVACMDAQLNVPDQEYRCPPSDHQCVSLHNIYSFEQHTSREKVQVGLGYPFTINFVEFKDNGDLWNHTELRDAVAQVKDAAGTDDKTSVLLMVYVHGWENNADNTPNQDVAKFTSMLMTRLAEEQLTTQKPMKVIGIYLAWRGLASNIEPFKHFFTYWPRRNVARHVGLTGIREAISEIEDAAKPHRKQYVIVFAGHSFGARVLENAAESKDTNNPGFMREYRQKVQKRKLGPLFATNPTLPADLILFVNAATSSTVTRATIKDLQKTCTPGATESYCGADPFYVAFTSHADSATGIIMPIANLVLPAPSDHLRLISAANSPDLHTHDDPKPGCDHGPQQVCFAVGPGPKDKKTIHPIPNKRQLLGSDKEPFWIFNVGGDVMSSHGDVWNPWVTDLVTHIIIGNPQYQALQ